MKLVTLCSGGLDSVTLAYLLHSQGFTQEILFVAYGQRHITEHQFAYKCATDLGLRISDVEIRGQIFSSALTDFDIAVPSGEYTPETLSTLVVPNRNAIFANLAAALAVSKGYDGIALAIHSGDHEVYPDCRPIFIDALRDFLCTSIGKSLSVLAPFLSLTKKEIVRRGLELDVPFEHTWSCYKGGDIHCGICPTCRERKEAFFFNGILHNDPTEYAE